MSPRAPDVECAVTWKEAKQVDLNPFNFGVFMGGSMACRTCVVELDVWCQEHVSPYVPFEERRNPPTGAAADLFEAWCDYLEVLHNKERDLRRMLIPSWIEAGVTLEPNPPSDILVSSSPRVWKDSLLS